MSEAEWARLAPLLPRSGRGGQWRDHKQVLNGICWRLRTGAPWRDVPARYGPWQTLDERFSRWRADGTWARLLDAVRTDAALAGLLDLDLFHVDSAWARARRVRADLPRRKDQKPRGRPPCFDREAYRRRPAIERLIGRLKEWRAVGTRDEKLAVNYLAVVQVALLRDFLRLLDSSDRA